MSTVRRTDASGSAKVPVRRRRLGRHRLRALIVSLVLVPVCFVWIYPFLWTVSAALKTNPEIFGGLGLIPQSPQWNNFARAWTEANIGRYFGNTLLITAGSVVLVVVTTAMIGYVLGRYAFPGKRVVVGLLVATVFLPEGYTIIPTVQLINALGVGDSLFGVILGESGGAHVLYILLFSGYFSRLPNELEEAAIIDGASFPRIFTQVMLPLAAPVIATVTILQAMRAWNDFLLPLVLTLSRPELRTLSVGIYAFRGEYFVDWSGMAAAAVISIAPIVLLFLFLQRFFVEGIAGSVKQ